MHMATSVLPSNLSASIRRSPGIGEVAPILYLPVRVSVGPKKSFAYLVGYDGQLGGPWALHSGTISLAPGEVIVDRAFADRNGLTLGDSIEVAGRRFALGGLARETYSLASSLVFMRLDDARKLLGAEGVVSYYLIRLRSQKTPAGVVAERLRHDLGLNALTREELSAGDRRVILTMGADVMKAMAAFATLVGFSVVGLTVYTATLKRVREFGILKAVGAKPWQLYVLVAFQSLFGALAGYLGGVLVTLVLSVIIPSLNPSIAVALTSEVLWRVLVLSVVMSLIAGAVPIRTIKSIDPLLVFKT
ncbi:MAG: ABC transporter permease [Firmicutes bacterium]|nr:ABC transporter permease [Bacillota bacterium]